MASKPTASADGWSDTAEEASPVDAIGDLVVVSNREPYQYRYSEEEGVVVDVPVGGLTGSLDRVLRRTDGTWIAWGDSKGDPAVVNAADYARVPPDDPSYTLRRMWLGQDAVREHYYGFANQVLWPVCHDIAGKAEFDRSFWERYRGVNERFADVVVEHASDASAVWFQDYHLALAPRLVREALPSTVPVVQFWHIPWPASDSFRACPRGQRLLEGLLGNDLLGFHAPAYCENFLDCVARELDGARVDRTAGEVVYDGHTTRVRAFPMGVDAARIRRLSADAAAEFWPAFRREYGVTGSTVAVGVDRLDYTGGVPERIDALERFWERNPEWRGELTYVQKEIASHCAAPDVQRLRTDVRDAIERVNGRFGTDEWTPIVYVDDRLPDAELYALYRHSDLALVTPVRDGPNLVAEEYVAAQGDAPGESGVLVLSALASADADLAADALTVEPYDTDSFAATVEDALSMPARERADRMDRLRSTVRANDLDVWMGDVFQAIGELRQSRTASDLGSAD